MEIDNNNIINIGKVMTKVRGTREFGKIQR